jgi:hypothetical protein
VKLKKKKEKKVLKIQIHQDLPRRDRDLDRVLSRSPPDFDPRSRPYLTGSARFEDDDRDGSGTSIAPPASAEVPLLTGRLGI